MAVGFVTLPPPTLYTTRHSKLDTSQRRRISFARCNGVRAKLQNPTTRVETGVPSIREWSSLRSSEFDQLFVAGKLPLCLIGMSNCGKSHWTNELVSKYGFAHVCVDDEIEHAIQPELTALGYAGIADMARWMGYPSDERFADNEARYLQIEEKVTSKVNPSVGTNFVLDTTGSVVYLSLATQQRLRAKFFIVHLAADDSTLESLRSSYFESPKPVVWGDSYNQLENEEPNDALRRCYEDLLRERLKRYHNLAHLSIPAEFGFSPDATVEQLLELIRANLTRPE